MIIEVNIFYTNTIPRGLSLLEVRPESKQQTFTLVVLAGFAGDFSLSGGGKFTFCVPVSRRGGIFSIP